jgi:hypothetical protein
MTAATAEALAKTLNALVREGWGEPSFDEMSEDPDERNRQLAQAFAREARFLNDLAGVAKQFGSRRDVVHIKEPEHPEAS